MRITLNLASKPFIELRPLYTRLRLWMLLLLLVAIPLWMLLRVEQRKAALANARLQSVETNIQRLQNQQRASQALMSQPQNAAVLTQADFLNAIFARKSFSWTAIMMDLENVLPSGVQVLNIDPTPDKAGNVTVRLRVSGQRDRAVELVRNLEHSKRFLQPRLAGESLETNANGGQANFQPVSATSNVNFDVLAEYNPLPPTVKPAAKHAEADQPSGAPQKRVTRSVRGPAAVAPPRRTPSPTPNAGGVR